MQLEVGKIYEGKVSGITKFGAFVDIAPGVSGMVHISEVSTSYVKEIRDYLKEEQTVKVKVLSLGEKGRISLSMKNLNSDDKQPNNKNYTRNKNDNSSYSTSRSGGNNSMSFEEMLTKFKQSSEEKMSSLKRFSDNRRSSYSKKK